VLEDSLDEVVGDLGCKGQYTRSNQAISKSTVIAQLKRLKQAAAFLVPGIQPTSNSLFCISAQKLYKDEATIDKRRGGSQVRPMAQGIVFHTIYNTGLLMTFAHTCISQGQASEGS
jgi:hypothetical protein